MSFEKYLFEKYKKACDLQREIADDNEIIESIGNNNLEIKLARRWMTNYGLFQEMNDSKRNSISEVFIKFTIEHERKQEPLKDDEIMEIAMELSKRLHKESKRSWLSATSKLLWCIYPNDIAIYDSHAYKSITILQCIQNELSEFERIGSPGAAKEEKDLERQMKFYIKYQSMIKKLLESNKENLNKLRKKHKEKYPYDIRIIDKIPWMMGDTSDKY